MEYTWSVSFSLEICKQFFNNNDMIPICTDKNTDKVASKLGSETEGFTALPMYSYAVLHVRMCLSRTLCLSYRQHFTHVNKYTYINKYVY